MYIEGLALWGSGLSHHLQWKHLMSASFSPSCSISNSAPYHCTWESKGGISTWVHATHVRNAHGVPGSWVWSGPSTGFYVHLRNEIAEEDIVLSLSLSRNSRGRYCSLSLSLSVCVGVCICISQINKIFKRSILSVRWDKYYLSKGKIT